MEEEKRGMGGRGPLTRREKVLRGVMVAVAGIAAVALIALVALLNWVREPELPDQPVRPTRPQESTEPGGSPPPQVSSDRKERFWTFLIIGRDTYGGGNTDTILLAAYDVENQTFHAMNIPRDTMVNVSWDIKRINSVYNAYGGGQKGMDALKEEISQLVGFTPDFTVTVEWEAVGEIVDAIGGVWFDVPRRMYYNDLSQNFVIDLEKGYQLLDGDKAMQLLRYRHDSDEAGNILGSGYVDGDLGRIRVQQDFLRAAIEQCLEKIDPGTLMALGRVFLENVQVDGLDLGNLVWFGQQALMGNSSGKKLEMENVTFATMPCTGKYVLSRTSGYQSYVLPVVDELVAYVNENLNPYLDDLRSDELDIMYVNSDGTLGATGGTLADTRYNDWILQRNAAASATPTPTATPSPEETEETEESEVIPSPEESSPPPEESPQPQEESGAAEQQGERDVSILPAMPVPVQP